MGQLIGRSRRKDRRPGFSNIINSTTREKVIPAHFGNTTILGKKSELVGWDVKLEFSNELKKFLCFNACKFIYSMGNEVSLVDST